MARKTKTTVNTTVEDATLAASTCAAQCRALVLYSLDSASKVAEQQDMAGHWDDADSDVLLALDAARGIIAGLAPGGGLLQFESAWYRALAVVTLAKRCYSPGLATAFGRTLAGIEEQLRVLPELWEVVARDWGGDHG